MATNYSVVCVVRLSNRLLGTVGVRPVLKDYYARESGYKVRPADSNDASGYMAIIVQVAHSSLVAQRARPGSRTARHVKKPFTLARL